MGNLRNKLKRNKRSIAAVVALLVAIIMLASMAVPFFM